MCKPNGCAHIKVNRDAAALVEYVTLPVESVLPPFLRTALVDAAWQPAEVPRASGSPSHRSFRVPEPQRAAATDQGGRDLPPPPRRNRGPAPARRPRRFRAYSKVS